MQSDRIEKCHNIHGDKCVLRRAGVRAGCYSDPRGKREVEPEGARHSGSTAELSQIMALCHEAGQPILEQGGLAGQFNCLILIENLYWHRHQSGCRKHCGWSIKPATYAAVFRPLGRNRHA